MAYDFLMSVHVAVASPEFDYADYDVGPAWVQSARARCAARDANALALLDRYFGSSMPGALHATLISLVVEAPAPRDVEDILAWLARMPIGRFVEALLDQDGLGDGWQERLAAVLAAGPRAVDDSQGDAAHLLDRFAPEVRPTVTAILRDPEAMRTELVAALRVWNEAVISGERERVLPLIQREAAVLARQRSEMPLDRFIKVAMRGVEWQRPAGLRKIVFAPSYYCRPAVFYHFWRGVLTFCLPVEADVLEAAQPSVDPGAPGEEILRFYEALGDDTRLRILRLLAEREMYLTELAEHLGLTKATTKHHMVRLRAAGCVTLYDRDRMTYYALRPDISRRAAQLIQEYLGRPPNRA